MPAVASPLYTWMVFLVVSRITKQFGHSRDMDLDFMAKFHVHGFVQVVVQLLQELFTGKQTRHPLSF